MGRLITLYVICPLCETKRSSWGQIALKARLTVDREHKNTIKPTSFETIDRAALGLASN
jgi:hypothetical protein